MLARKTAPLALALAVGLAAVPSPAGAQDVAGQWLLSVELDAGTGDATFTFSVEGNQLTGTYAGLFGEQAVTGTIEGDVVEFGFESVDAGGAVSFEGVVDGDTMDGTCIYGTLGTGTFFGSRTD